MNYCRSLRFEDKIDYLHLRKMFKELFYREKLEWDYLFDWTQPIDVTNDGAGEKGGSFKIYLLHPSGSIEVDVEE